MVVPVAMDASSVLSFLGMETQQIVLHVGCFVVSETVQLAMGGACAAVRFPVFRAQVKVPNELYSAPCHES